MSEKYTPVSLEEIEEWLYGWCGLYTESCRHPDVFADDMEKRLAESYQQLVEAGDRAFAEWEEAFSCGTCISFEERFTEAMKALRAALPPKKE